MDFASNDLWTTLFAAQAAAIISMLATGLGPLPLLWSGDKLKNFLGEAYAFSGGLMFSASFFNLMGPGLERDHVWKVALGVFLGCLAFWAADRAIRNREWKMWDLEDAGARRIALIIGTMVIHSLPEGLAIGGIDSFLDSVLGQQIAVPVSRQFDGVNEHRVAFYQLAIETRIKRRLHGPDALQTSGGSRVDLLLHRDHFIEEFLDFF